MDKTYNLKVFVFENGSAEVRKYSVPISPNKDAVKKRLEGKRDVLEDLFIKEYNPFTDKVEYMEDMYCAKELEKRANHNLRVSFNRTVNEIYKLSRQCTWEYFITLTFDKTKVDRYNFDECMKKANSWFNNQRKRYAKDLQYLFVPEQHKDGAWHIHGLLSRVGEMSFVDSGKKINDKVIYNLSGWKNGFSTATEVEDIQRVSSYIVKYITKELCEVTKGKRRYYRSQNIPKPSEEVFLLESGCDVEFIDTLADSLGFDVSYVKTVKGEYMDIEYIYLNTQKESEEKKNERSEVCD